ncbi:hypothetical protein [Arthrobacter antioxidans]|uniref:hypothetical protein n=1 Tax=Arthrobacter antioxidans TaxID=2895818 RepID=UPI001FFEBC82|nr:hypothetical protein [Arthrobacter antioxidans]
MRAPSTLPTLAISIGLLLSGPAAADASPAPAPTLSDQVSPPAPSASPLPAMTGTTPAAPPTTPPVEQSPSEPAVPTDPPADVTPPVEDVIDTAPGTTAPEPTATPTTSPEPAPDMSPAPPAADAPTTPASPADGATPKETDPAEAPALPDGGQQPGVGESVVVDRSVPRAPQPVPAPAENGAAPSRVPTPVDEVRIDKVDQAEQAEALQQPAEGTSLRYTVAGILSIVALLLALAIAFVAQPRRRRGTH